MKRLKILTRFYIGSMSHSSAEKVKDAFHSNGKVVGVLAGMDSKKMSKLNAGESFGIYSTIDKERLELLTFIYGIGYITNDFRNLRALSLRRIGRESQLVLSPLETLR
jgi:hypothetical protein